jgi:hypothetical protein
MTNVSVKEETAERITNTGKFYQLVRGILWKWEVPKKQKTCLLKSYCIPYYHLEQKFGHEPRHQ